MLYAELITRRSLVLQEKKHYKYVLYEATKEETDDLFEEIRKYSQDKENYKDEKWGFLRFVDFFGEVDDVFHYHIKDMIPHDETCYQRDKPENIFNNLKVHEDKLSGFRCACERINSKSFIVLRIPINHEDHVEEEQIQEAQQAPTDSEENILGLAKGDEEQP